MVRRIIIDADPGCDDALAIAALLKSSEVQVLGITAVGGNRPLEYTYVNALRLVDMFHYDCDVYKGVPGPLSVDPSIKTSLFHGVNGFGDIEVPYTEKHLSEIDAVTYLRETLDAYPDEIEIVALGPLSNLATLYLQAPDTFRKIKAIYSMGGTFGKGNITPYCEFNYYFDLKATEVIMNALDDGVVPFHMFALDITRLVMFDMNEFTMLKMDGGAMGSFFYDIFMGSYMPKSWHNYGCMGCVQHDLVAGMYPIVSELYDEVAPTGVAINHDPEKKGQLLRKESNARIYVHQHVQAVAMKREFFRRIFGNEMVARYEVLLKNRDSVSWDE